MRVELWTDGSGTARGPGGWAYVLRAIETTRGDNGGMNVLRQTEGSDWHPETTNNRMELTALLEGLKAIKRPNGLEVFVFTDSEYVMHPFTKGWLKNWEKRGWRTSSAKGPEVDEAPFMCPLCALPAVERTEVCWRHMQPVVMNAPRNRKAVLNRDLWEMIDRKVNRPMGPIIHWNWVAGHTGVVWNERCDEMAGEARRNAKALLESGVSIEEFQREAMRT